MVFLGYTSAVFVFVLVSSSESQSDFSNNASATLATSLSTLNWMPSKPDVVIPDDEIDDVYPNHRNYSNECRHSSEPKWLCNADMVLTQNEASLLEKQLEILYETDNICPCQEVYCSYNGFPMVVVVLSTFQFNNAESFEDKHREIESVAGRFLNEWDFDTCDDGAVTVVVANESLVVTLVGETSISTVSVSCQEAIENATKIFFLENRLFDGLLELIKQYRLAVSKDHPCNSHELIATERAVKMRVMIPILLILVGLIVAAIIAGVLLTYRQRRSKDITTSAGQPLRDRQLLSENA